MNSSYASCGKYNNELKFRTKKYLEMHPTWSAKGAEAVASKDLKNLLIAKQYHEFCIKEIKLISIQKKIQAHYANLPTLKNLDADDLSFNIALTQYEMILKKINILIQDQERLIKSMYKINISKKY